MKRLFQKNVIVIAILSLFLMVSCGSEEAANPTEGTGVSDILEERETDMAGAENMLDKGTAESSETDEEGVSSGVTEESKPEGSTSDNKLVGNNKNNSSQNKPGNTTGTHTGEPGVVPDTPDNSGNTNPSEEQPEIEVILPPPWESGGKQPSEYTWAEFEALSGAHQMAFQQSFGSVEAFDAWMQKAQGKVEILPWENGGKQPSEYTWAEFEALTAGQQMAFQQSFGSIEVFEAWQQKAEGDEMEKSDLPWANGGKQPSEYTWAEFEALTGAQQMAFQQSFDSIEAFDAWMQKAQGNGTDKNDMPWENGGKQPSEYTWAEFEALTAGQQMAFQQSFGSIEAFDAWMQKAQAEESGEADLPWASGGKQPSEYTWAEFEALTGAQQMAFQNSFASIEEFDKWLTANQPQ